MSFQLLIIYGQSTQDITWKNSAAAASAAEHVSTNSCFPRVVAALRPYLLDERPCFVNTLMGEKFRDVRTGDVEQIEFQTG
jgi:hypothetical protein